MTELRPKILYPMKHKYEILNGGKNSLTVPNWFLHDWEKGTWFKPTEPTLECLFSIFTSAILWEANKNILKLY